MFASISKAPPIHGLGVPTLGDQAKPMISTSLSRPLGQADPASPSLRRTKLKRFLGGLLVALRGTGGPRRAGSAVAGPVTRAWPRVQFSVCFVRDIFHLAQGPERRIWASGLLLPNMLPRPVTVPSDFPPRLGCREATIFSRGPASRQLHLQVRFSRLSSVLL